MQIALGSTLVELLPGRAAFLARSKTLVVADLHLGKAATFRNRGLPVPEGSNAADLSRLQKLVERNQPERLVIAGDLFHSADGLSSSTIDHFQDWLHKLKLPVILTEGNHDRRSWFADHHFPIEVHLDLEIDELIITHDPADLPTDKAGIAGHLHPGVRIRESRRQSLRVPGFFVKNAHHLVLPAFSEFTGIQPLKLAPEDQFYAEVNEQISLIPNSLMRS